MTNSSMSAAKIWLHFRAGKGGSHPVHMEKFGIPGKTMLGSDSHTCAAGSLGMIAIGTGGLESQWQQNYFSHYAQGQVSI